MNAITWCLYGDEMFKSQKNIGRKLINEGYVYAMKPFDDEVHASVKVTIGEDKPQFIFERDAAFSKLGQIVKEGKVTFKGTRITDRGYEDLSEPDWYVEHRFVPRSLRSFFFFDGEKMDSYFEDAEKIMKYIEELAQINTLNSAIETMKKVLRKINAEVKEAKGFGNVDYLNYTSIEADRQKAKKE